MRVGLIAPGGNAEMWYEHLAAQVSFFRQREDDVRVYLSTPAAGLPVEVAGVASVSAGPDTFDTCDLCVYHYAGDYSLLASIRRQTWGVLLAHDHGCTPQGWLPAHYADLCLVDSPERRAALVSDHGLAPERVCLLPGPQDPTAYGAVLAEWVARALADEWPSVRRPETPVVRAATAPETFPANASLRAGLNLARSQADVMLRSYQVSSRLPLVGRLVAWLRRQSTSHLREPYLDPTLERQVTFNRSVVTWMEQAQARLEELETRVQLLEGLIEEASLGATLAEQAES